MFRDNAFCVVRQANVHIAWTQLPIHDGLATLPDSPVPVCLDFGEACNVRRCPTFQVPRTVMAVWVARSGHGAERLPIVKGNCIVCGAAADLQRVDPAWLYCPVCGGIGMVEEEPPTSQDGAA